MNFQVSKVRNHDPRPSRWVVRSMVPITGDGFDRKWGRQKAPVIVRSYVTESSPLRRLSTAINGLSFIRGPQREHANPWTPDAANQGRAFLSGNSPTYTLAAANEKKKNDRE